MKLVYSLIAFIFFASAAMAQTALTSDEVNLIQDVWGKDKKELFKEYMNFDPEEGTAFWPIYEEYVTQRKELGKDRLKVMTDYANTYDNLNDEAAKDITDRVFSNNIALEKLQKKYYKKMSKVIGPVQASKFMQMEKYIDSIVRLEVQDQIPFIDELEELRAK